MSANTTAMEAGGMSLEGWCVLAMGALFGLFLLGVWWELRRALRSVAREEKKRARALVRFESEEAFGRQLAREAASQRVALLRDAHRGEVEAAQAAAREQKTAEPALGMELGMESVGRILERLAQVPSVEEEVPSFNVRPTLNMVRGGKGRENETGEEQQEDSGSAGEVAASGRGRARPGSSGGRAAARGKAGNGVKSGAIGSGSISASALAASR